MDTGFFVQYTMGNTEQQTNNINKQKKAIKHDFNTMVEAENNLKKQIELVVEKIN